MASFTFETKLPIPISAKELQERIKSLFAIKDALDSEIETLIGRKADHSGNLYHCLRCDYKWNSRMMRRPTGCPKCRTKKFDQKPAYTYEEKLKRKQDLEAKRVPVVSSTPIPPAPMAHSVLTRQVSLESDSIQNVALTPPPTAPMSLRERLAQMSKREWAIDVEASARLNENNKDGEILIPIQKSAAAQSEDELMEAINGDNDVT